MAFWRMIKEGYDHFEVTRQEPKVDVCEKHYVFDAELSSKFSAADRCPAYKVPETSSPRSGTSSAATISRPPN